MRTRQIVLFAALAAAVVAYLLLQPRLRSIGAETARLKQQNGARQAEAVRIRQLQQQLAQARLRAEQNPRDASAQLGLASLCNVSNDLDGAAEHAETAARLAPKDVRPLLLLGDVEQHRRHFNAAIDAYRAALRIDPNNQAALTALGFLEIGFGWPLDAEALLEPAVKRAPDNPYLKVALAAAYSQHEEYARAAKLLEDARRLAPNEPSVWAPLARVYNDMKRPQEAVRVATEALAKDSANVILLNERGEARLRLGSVQEALADFQRAAALDPGNVPAQYSVARCYAKLGRTTNATRELEQVVQRGGPAQARFMLGRLYLQQGRTAEGERLLAEFRRAQAEGQKREHAGLILAGQPRNADAHWRMAQVYRSQGDMPRMEVELRRTLELDPNHAGARQMLARKPS